MKPNWLLLWYIVAAAGGMAAAFLLASLAVGTRLLSWALGIHVGAPDTSLLTLAAVALGVLPWPIVIVLVRAIISPRRAPNAVAVQPLGPIAVSLVALNEEQAVADVVRDFGTHPKVASVIVVDNNSTDRTAELAAKAGARVVREERRGYGFACRRGLREGLLSGHPIIILCEADRTFRADDISKLIAYLQHTDVVMGSRTHHALLDGGSQLNSFLTLGNVFVGKLLQLRYWDWTWGGRVRLTDVGCTYMAFRAEAVAGIAPSLQVGGNHFVPHLVMVAHEHGLRIVQVPITFWPRLGLSKGGNASWGKALRLGLTMILHILTYRVTPIPNPSDSSVCLPKASTR